MTNQVKIIHNFVQALRSAKGANEKKSVLSRAFDHTFIADFLIYVYSPRLSYYQTQLKMDALPRMLLGKVEPTETLDGVYAVLHQFDSKEHLGKAGAQQLCKAAHALSPEGRELVQIILDRDLKAGVAEKTINTAYLGRGFTTKLINTMPYQRYDDMNADKLAKMDFSKGVFSQLKSDGMFGNIVVGPGGDTALFSRSGSPITGKSVQPLLDEAEGNCLDGGIGNCVFHGELLVRDTVTGEILPRAVGNGLLNSVIQTGAEMDTRYRLEYRVWDWVPYDAWYSSTPVTIPYEERFNIVEQLFQPLDDTETLITVQESVVVRSFREAVDHLKAMLARKEEGTIWKPFDMPWEDGTSSYGMKGKLIMECELRIIGFKEGDPKGKHAKTFGSIMMESEDKLLQVNVSGMPDAMRKHIHEHRDEFLARIATVMSNGVQDKTDNPLKSLFLPRLVEVRDDRTHADDLPRIYQIQESVIDAIAQIFEGAN